MVKIDVLWASIKFLTLARIEMCQNWHFQLDVLKLTIFGTFTVSTLILEQVLHIWQYFE